MTLSKNLLCGTFILLYSLFTVDLVHINTGLSVTSPRSTGDVYSLLISCYW